MLVAAAILSACLSEPRETLTPENFGFYSSDAQNELIKSAVEISNTILKSSHMGTHRFTTIPDGKEKNGIPVFGLSSLNLDDSDVIWKPQDCKCVFVHGWALKAWLDQAEDASGIGDSLEQSYIVAYQLLHEMGHVVQEQDGSFGDERITSTNVNLDETLSKKIEADADKFANEALAQALQGPSESAVAARDTIANLRVLASNYYYGHFIEQDLESLLCITGKFYWDKGYSHHNLIYRLLLSVNWLAPSPEVSKAIKEFDSCRNDKVIIEAIQ